jgi:hypothetical protein
MGGIQPAFNQPLSPTCCSIMAMSNHQHLCRMHAHILTRCVHHWLHCRFYSAIMLTEIIFITVTSAHYHTPAG